MATLFQRRPVYRSISARSQTALRTGFRYAGASSEERRQISVNRGRAADSRQIRWRLEARKNGVGNLASRNALLTIA